ncbi:hypothetical protein HID58_049272, partial [Brassica napus]
REEVRWRMNLGGGSDRCWSVVGSDRCWSVEKSRLLSSTESGGSPHRFSLAPLDESRWLSSKNHGGYPRRIKSVDLPEDENLQLLVIAIERINGSKERSSCSAHVLYSKEIKVRDCTLG